MFSIIHTEKFCDCLSCWIGLEYVVLRKYTFFKAFRLLQLHAATIYKDKHCTNSISGYGLKPSEQIRTVSGDMSHMYLGCVWFYF